MTECPDSSASQRNHSAGARTVVKLESGTFALTSLKTLTSSPQPLTSPEATELHFLHSRVRELEREKAELSAENQSLKNMLVHEIPGLVSVMWQTLGRVSGPQSISTATNSSDSYNSYTHLQYQTQDRDFSPEVKQVQDELSRDVSEYWASLDSADEEVPVSANLGLGTYMGEEAPLCSQTDMEELRRSCSESQCTAGEQDGQVSQVEVYPGSGVLCDVRSWHAANQAQSPTAMARMLLLGVFDMGTLMNSNLRGGRSRRPSYHHQHNALDPHKTNAIFNAILARFPLAKKGVIGSGINSKLSEIRFHCRRANRDHQLF
ncbi:uncharacterized protein LOC114447508 [Parambassis ranga]|uniref:Uncharacterized protein LOC114447508 n=1 Tax=Parambassis ranga TaxID=210632 RepID=A0A6P7JRN8_9TELE|nr:uncharacterized protein LOC114447508 [Parambassis ranga]